MSSKAGSCYLFLMFVSAYKKRNILKMGGVFLSKRSLMKQPKHATFVITAYAEISTLIN